ncbi:hypothetical protein TRFO_01956 [Tritrichomonas foetus]|uniref:Leucine Rich Repeat family protein n=1 Tax=Tritrichomonas foetus TaxID=1144522 RepID=A0A1J4JHB6_9EUKA|nr:hypothetical protein TRFO_01956 [Tritrichomonas foetus]|eukprot:OHS96877.1 hypothetical protein TRFO_01956 [Tritrichomonas foetus]
MQFPSFARRATRQPFEFERPGQSSARPSAAHQPDFTLSVSNNANENDDFGGYSGYNEMTTSANQPTFDQISNVSNYEAHGNSFYYQNMRNNNIQSNNQISPRNGQKNQIMKQKARRKVLDTLFLVDLFNTSKFDQFEKINASSKHLTDVDLDALRELTQIKKADFSDNFLPLEPFSILPNLEQLDLSCNDLKKFDFNYSNQLTEEKAWSSLHTLDLSHNLCFNIISDLSMIPLLTNLNLSSNSLTLLPSNLMQFTCLTDLDLSNNNLNSDLALFSLATIPSLQTLNLDRNNIIHIPKFQFGFESLLKISLKYNKLEMSEDMDSLADLNLQEVNIIGNPICIRHSHLSEIKKICANAKIDLICDAPPPPSKPSLMGPFRSVPLDPLTLPFFSKNHIRALKKKSMVRGSQKVPPLNFPNQENLGKLSDNGKNTKNENEGDVDVFMTAFQSKSIEPTQLPSNSQFDNLEDTFSNSQLNIWSEIPVVQEERRKKLTMKVRPLYIKSFNQLQFIVKHPEAKISTPRSQNGNGNDEEDGYINYNNIDDIDALTIDEIPEFAIKEPETSRRKKSGRINSLGRNFNNSLTNSLSSTRVNNKSKRSGRSPSSRRREEIGYTKSQINDILTDMDEKLMAVEREMQIADDSGRTKSENMLDQDKFAALHKQHETIRANLMNTLNPNQNQ